ncbi:hypothetical protein D3C76_1440710 [compost metagenome]
MPVAGIADRRSLLDVVFGVVQGADPAIADVAMEIGVVEQFENEGGIVGIELAQDEALGEDHGKGLV